MAFNITDNDELTIYINDGWKELYIPKFRLFMEVNEPNITLWWADNEKGKQGITRKLVMDYNDVTFGYLTPTSASEVELVINDYIISAWQSIWSNFTNYVPYIGALNNVDLGTYGMLADYVAFSLTPVASPGAGQIAYDGQTGSLSYLLNNSNVVSNIGQTLHAYVHNAEGSPITKGQVVYLYEASGNKASVKLARNLSDSTSAKTLGLCAEDIPTNKNGMVICQGKITGLDTSAFVDGATLYLANTYGDVTDVKPYAPEHLVYIGVVEKASNGNGEIYVRPQNGYELSEIHDVDLITTPPSSGDVLTYNGSLWVNQAPASGSGTVTSIATSSPITGGTITTSGTIGIDNAKADGTTKGASTFEANDFNDNGSGLIRIDYTNGQKATSLQNGFLTSTDWTTFNNKGSGTVTSVGTSSPLTGGTITGSGTIGIQDAVADGSTKGASTFNASDFNSSSGVISIDYTNGQSASSSNKGFLTSADWTTFNNKGNGTVTSVSALTLGTSGTDLSSSVATSTTTPVITLNVPTASATNRGALSSTDWSTFNGKQATLVSGTNIKTINGTSILGSGDLDTAYTLSVQALTSSPVDGQTIYFGNLPKAPVTTANISKVYIPRAGNITRAEIYCYSGTAGTNENWSGYIRLNNTTDTLIATLGVATNERRFSNTALSISVVAGDYIEIKFINPTWATNPLTTIFGGYIYIE